MWHSPQSSTFLSDNTSDAFLTDGGEVYKTGHLSIGLILLGALPSVSLGWPWAPGRSRQSLCSHTQGLRSSGQEQLLKSCRLWKMDIERNGEKEEKEIATELCPGTQQGHFQRGDKVGGE